ncbi:MAG: hypothetical protein AVDCRST_MAG89-1413, partial [uncultured Gemmatimonadetes bacterium]
VPVRFRSRTAGAHARADHPAALPTLRGRQPDRRGAGGAAGPRARRGFARRASLARVGPARAELGAERGGRAVAVVRTRGDGIVQRRLADHRGHHGRGRAQRGLGAREDDHGDRADGRRGAGPARGAVRARGDGDQHPGDDGRREHRGAARRAPGHERRRHHGRVRAEGSHRGPGRRQRTHPAHWRVLPDGRRGGERALPRRKGQRRQAPRAPVARSRQARFRPPQPGLV